MSTQPIEHKGYGYSFKQPSKIHDEAEFSLDAELSKRRQETGSEAKKSSRDHIRRLLEGIPKRAGNRLSFTDISEYRTALESKWDMTVTRGLEAVGVDLTRTFHLSFDATTGSVTASSDHPDKAAIDAYFDTDAEVSEEFDTLVQLGKLVDVAERSLSSKQREQTLDSDAMTWWFQSSLPPSALFCGGGVIFGMGGSSFMGVDILV
ncbi:hypothetical protein [Pseudodesulfovibrio piezophilus]|uniref:Uncharacterized protein n=1 Tax=Pseudodesulfovibrio piezophilus (strain DSM 21447 / JCM 15486 / C1TLV30) TaxID=1322246 RepID=M1WVA4_PSEP2|nr:hypothetical protein [Pseudodesulfovibrio piezophilus]CCH48283.1 conserved protein of unknown function [Pseudodesulfovibrio piezophilus C1TLV30]